MKIWIVETQGYGYYGYYGTYEVFALALSEEEAETLAATARSERLSYKPAVSKYYEVAIREVETGRRLLKS